MSSNVTELVHRTILPYKSYDEAYWSMREELEDLNFKLFRELDDNLDDDYVVFWEIVHDGSMPIFQLEHTREDFFFTIILGHVDGDFLEPAYFGNGTIETLHTYYQIVDRLGISRSMSQVIMYAYDNGADAPIHYKYKDYLYDG